MDIGFTPARVGILPGESVTWSYPTGGNAHNVHFEDGLYTFPAGASPSGWTGSRTFPTEGAFRYYCVLHGGPGGSGMSGTVFVNDTGTVVNEQPRAGLMVFPTTVAIGADVTLTGSSSLDSDGQIVKFEWDLDGDGTYEQDTGPVAQVKQSYATPGPRTVRMRVTDNQGATAGQARDIVVTQPPVAGFTVSPNPATRGQAVSFDSTSERRRRLDHRASVGPQRRRVIRDEHRRDAQGVTHLPGRRNRRGRAARVRRPRPGRDDDARFAGRGSAGGAAGAAGDRHHLWAHRLRSRLRRRRLHRCRARRSRARPARRACRGPAGRSRGASAPRASPRAAATSRTRGARAASSRAARICRRSRRASCGRSSCRYLKGAKRKACNRKYARSRTAGRR